MGERESHDARQEALREVLDHPERGSEHEEALLRYLGGVAYHEKQKKARERKPRGDAAEEGPS